MTFSPQPLGLLTGVRTGMPYYLGLLTENGEEVSGRGYQRTFLQDFNFEDYQNPGTIQFPEARGDWGTVTHFGIYSQLQGGECFLQVPPSTVRVVSGVVIEVRPYNFTVQGMEGIQEDPEPPSPPPKTWQERLVEDLF
jgi:hypothetical protein